MAMVLIWALLIYFMMPSTVWHPLKRLRCLHCFASSGGFVLEEVDKNTGVYVSVNVLAMWWTGDLSRVYLPLAWSETMCKIWRHFKTTKWPQVACPKWMGPNKTSCCLITHQLQYITTSTEISRFTFFHSQCCQLWESYNSCTCSVYIHKRWKSFMSVLLKYNNPIWCITQNDCLEMVHKLARWAEAISVSLFAASHLLVRHLVWNDKYHRCL